MMKKWMTDKKKYKTLVAAVSLALAFGGQSLVTEAAAQGDDISITPQTSDVAVFGNDITIDGGEDGKIEDNQAFGTHLRMDDTRQSGIFGSTSYMKNGYESFSFGNDNTVLAPGATALGSKVYIGENASGATAIGYHAVANNAGEVSFGHSKGDTYAITTDYATDTLSTGTYDSDLYRKLTHVEDGTDDHDVATVGQMNEELDTKAEADASNVSDYASDWGKAIGTGEIKKDNDQLVTGGTVYNTIGEGTDGNYIQAKNTVNKNLEILDSEIGAAKTGEYIKGTNTINENLEALDTEVKDLSDNKADKDLKNITEAGETVIKNLASDAVKLADGTHTTVSSEVSGDTTTYKVNVVTDGKIENLNTGIVTGGQVFMALDDLGNEIDIDLDKKADIDAYNVGEYTANWGEAIGTGKIEAGNGELVTGGTVYNALGAGKDGNYIQAESTVNDNLYALDSKIGGAKDGNYINSSNTVNENLASIDTKIGEAKDGSYTKASNTVNDNIAALDSSVYQLGQNTDSRFEQTEQHISEVGAHAAALAALHPEDFDPEDRLSIAAGYGHYRGAGANAIGVFYQPTEDCTISAGRTFGGGHDMWNAGVSFKFGRGNSHNTMSRTQLTRQLDEQNKALEAANAKIARMQAQIDELMARVK